MFMKCMLFQQGKKVMEVPEAELATFAIPDNGFLWVAYEAVSLEELKLVQQRFSLHGLAVEDVMSGRQRPKIEEYGEDLFVVAHLVGEIEGKLHTEQVNIFAGANYVVSIVNQPEENFYQVWTRCEHESNMMIKGPGYVVYALIDAIVDRYFPLIEKIENELEKIEEQVFVKSNSQRTLARRLIKLRHKIGLLRRVVYPLMEAVGRLQSGRVPPVCNNVKAYFRDVSDHLIRLSTSLEGMRDSILMIIQVNMAMVTLEQTEVSKRLAAWAGIFAAATAFAGVWGMNFDFMPELHWTFGYPLALGVIVMTCFILYRLFRRAKWL